MRPVALVVDDEPDICELLSITLERMDVAARTCLDHGEEGAVSWALPQPSGTRQLSPN